MWQHPSPPTPIKAKPQHQDQLKTEDLGTDLLFYGDPRGFDSAVNLLKTLQCSTLKKERRANAKRRLLKNTAGFTFIAPCSY